MKDQRHACYLVVSVGVFMYASHRFLRVITRLYALRAWTFVSITYKAMLNQPMPSFMHLTKRNKRGYYTGRMVSPHIDQAWRCGRELKK